MLKRVFFFLNRQNSPLSSRFAYRSHSKLSHSKSSCNSFNQVIDDTSFDLISIRMRLVNKRIETIREGEKQIRERSDREKKKTILKLTASTEILLLKTNTGERFEHPEISVHLIEQLYNSFVFHSSKALQIG